MTTPQPFPPNALDYITHLAKCGWAFAVVPGIDTGDNPYISIEAKRPGDHRRLMVTWHTRDSPGGTYRLFSALQGNRTITLSKARQIAQEDPA